MEIETGDILLLLDMQNDFGPGGALPISGAENIAMVASLVAEFFDHVIVTQLWYPPGHEAFVSAHPGKKPFETEVLSYGPQILWPAHCVQGTPGAYLRHDLRVPQAELILRRGLDHRIAASSAFVENDRATKTGLAGFLREKDVKRLFLAGLPFDFTVRFTAEDGRREGFDVFVIEDACCALDIKGSAAEAKQSLTKHGVACVTSADILES
ncbi:isochorismatase family protein [Beijerinckia indica]|uniref:nicotinamidase n=1 Tax=Beijerinckia indica subsp. indica (strain ATCC 9039 / DSM 1715 / NCIMB 8712) TaxID=395963 RepID=B2IBD8_BEII9|nr:isochorismatase family protein [Beijerinckia indica]ACB95225.1 isochorismatase hydrolase [Beijerinckia indica subsp. indica ATCC 9039]